MTSILRPDITHLVTLFQKTRHDKLYDPNLPTIQAGHVMSHLSFVYEKLRNAIDYNEEHLLRKNAIQRILKRRIRVSLTRKNMGSALIQELIQAKYLENNFVPEAKIEKVDAVIRKYLFWLDSIGQIHGIKDKLAHFDWIIGIASCEVEEVLNLLSRDNAMVNTMYHTLLPVVDSSVYRYSQEVKELQLYVAIHRSLIRSDHSILAYHLINLSYPEFRQADEALIKKLAKDTLRLRRWISAAVSHPLNQKFSRLIHPYSVYFTILRDIIEKDEENAEAVFENPELLMDEVRVAVNKRYERTSAKLKRSIMNSVIYIFATKIILAFALEIPYDVFLLNELNLVPLSINILFPPTFMFMLAISAKIPGKKNAEAIFSGVQKLVRSDEEADELALKKAGRRSVIKTAFFSLIYVCIYLLSFGGVITLLTIMKFNIVSISLFLLFFCVVSFLGIKIRSAVKDLNVVAEKQGIFSSLLDFLFLPVLKVGRWISVKFSKFNVFAFALDLIIEAPFKTALALLEDWFSFMKEKKEDVM